MTRAQDVSDHKIGHITFRLKDCPRGGLTFSLIAHEALCPKDRKPLFTGHVAPGMANELRELAQHLDALEARSKSKTGSQPCS